MIVRQTFLTDSDGERFANNLSKTIGEMQKEGLRVEIQYKLANIGCAPLYSVLVLGRKIN